jgi:hypothetical protein
VRTTAQVDDSAAGRELLGRRVALASLVGACFTGAFVVYRVFGAFFDERARALLDPSFYFHVLGVIVLAATWASCRRGQRSRIRPRSRRRFRSTSPRGTRDAAPQHRHQRMTLMPPLSRASLTNRASS